jgi:electron transfer flavoprotein alpha subunit
MSVLAVLEQRAGQWHRMSFETLAAAQQIARELGTTASAAVLGHNIGALANDLATKQLGKVFVFDHELLKDYTPDAYTGLLAAHIDLFKPALVLFPHTYQVRDFLPKLATRLDRVAVSDVVAHRVEDGALTLVRQLFQGKVNADVRFRGDGPHFASLQAGAYRAGRVVEGTAPIEERPTYVMPFEIRTVPREPFRAAEHTVDLGAAELIVSVGRGIKESGNIPLIESLARALGAELAASRPICDAGWLPMERQVGSSGQTVAPKLYVAVGISGAIQHLVGMKGARTVVAINKDADAPIFEIADYGIVGDLFQVVPALIEALQKP